jgi:hypothetical protein
MKILVSILTCLMFTTFFCERTFGQEPEWLKTIKKIKPVIDNRQTVRSIFGKPEIAEENIDYFDIKEGRLTVYYSTGKCSPYDFYLGAKVPKDNVIQLSFSVSEDVKFSSLKINLKGFKTEIPEDTPKLKIYTNRITGIKYEVSFNTLSLVRIVPSISQSLDPCM